MARGACQTWGTLDDPQKPYLNNRITAGTSFTARHSTDNSCLWVILECFSTWARAHPSSISRERLNRFRWYLAWHVASGQLTSYVASTRLWGCHYARAHVHAPLPYLGNGWTDCADIWHVASGQLVMWLPHINGGGDVTRTCARAQPWPHFYISGTTEPIALIFGM